MKNLNFGGKLRFLRLSRSLTQSALARKSGVPEKTIERVEAGASAPCAASFLRLMKALKVESILDVIEPEDLEEGGAHD